MVRLLVIVASTRPGRVGGMVADWVIPVARGDDRFDVDVADLREMSLPLLDEPEHPRLRRYIHDHTRRWSATVDDAEAVMIVMPEYNHSFTAPLKNALDYLVQEWDGKPVGLVGYGGLSGGARAIVAVQPVLINLGLRHVRPDVEIAWVAEHLVDDTFVPTERHERALGAQLDQLAAAVGDPA